MKRLFIVLLLAVVALSACGRGGNDGDEREQITQNGGGVTIGSLQSGEGTLTLTISAPMGGGMAQINEAADRLQQELAQQGIDLHVEIISYEEHDEHLTTMLGQFAAGTGPDIFLRDNFMLYPFIENGFLMDIYTLIDASPNWSRADFYTNALSSFEVDGRLYALPMQFGFDMVGINATVPAEFLNRFAALDWVAPSDFIGLYLDLIAVYPEWADFALINGLSATQAFAPEISLAVDFANRVASFPANAAVLLNDIRTAFEDNNRFGTPPAVNATYENMTELQERYVFFRPLGISGTAEAFFNFSEQFFINYTPLADESGNFADRFWGLHICVSATADKALTWAFIEQLLSVTGTSDWNILGAPHITRRYTLENLTSGIRTSLMQFDLRPIFDSESINIDRTVDRIMTYAEHPTNFLKPNWLMPAYLFAETLTDFLDDGITAETAINQMEENITAWFNADRVAFDAYTPAEAEPEQNLPVQVLTVQTCSNHTNIFRQAADAMNTAWQERGEPYALHVEISSFDTGSIEVQLTRGERLRVELMAGQGPDIVFIDYWNDIIALANSGFLVDFNTLIENDPHVSRDDFFTQVLDAVEIGGSLYTFPVSFGFYYVGINAGLPQPFIDRFAAYSTVTVAQMMQFYLDLMAAHGDEFGHLSPGVSWSIGGFNNMVNAGMAGFVDIDARTSNLTDPEFIEFLNLIPQVFDGRDHIATPMSMNPAGHDDFIRRQAQSFVFEMESSWLNQSNAFFVRDTPHFVHYAPLVDNNGRLMFNTTFPPAHGTWANFAITAGGNVDLAWEFIQHLLQAYQAPTGRARTHHITGGEMQWASMSLASPIRRSGSEASLRRAFANAADLPGMGFAGMDDPNERNRQINDAVNFIAELNESPMALLRPHIPFIFGDTFLHFELGIITAQAAAQQMHNAVSLWLMEMG